MSYVIAVASPKGGTGKSTIARIAAVAFAHCGWDTAILDADVGQETCAQWYKRRCSSTSKKAITTRLDCHVAKGVSPLCGLMKDASFLDLIVVDTCPRAAGALAEYAEQADLILVPTGTGVDDLLPSIQFANRLVEAHSLNKDQVRFVLNHCSRNAKERTDAIEAIMGAGFKPLAAYLNESPAFRSALDEGLAPQETPYWQPRDKAKFMAEQIAHALEVVTA